MEFYNNFCENVFGFGMCCIALNYANNPLYFAMNQNVSQSVNSWEQCQEQLLQTKIDNLKYQMLESQINMQMQQSVIPNITFPSVYTEQKEKVIRNIYDLDKIIFPFDPIRDWTEKKCKEIEEKYKWLDEVEWR